MRVSMKVEKNREEQKAVAAHEARSRLKSQSKRGGAKNRNNPERKTPRGVQTAKNQSQEAASGHGWD